ncbi:hypothetical protein LDENG_00277520 [Lucifuga dentata]|nr:hypothetical protein LDENG_00277520 [Lucifuga dentata]
MLCSHLPLLHPSCSALPRQIEQRQNLYFSNMDAFVCKKLTEWDLSVLIDHFKDQGIDKESLYCLDKDDIAALIPQVGQRSKFKKHLKNLKQQETATVMVQGPDPNAERQALPSTSNTSHTEKRRSDHQSEPSKLSSSVKRPRGPLWGRNSAEDEKLSKVKKIMDCVNNKLDVQVQTKLTAFLKNKISDLKTDKRKLVGVFGKTGAGKSSLINAVIGEKNLLPCGSVKACTTVMIKVEANLNNNSYEADIEFISKEAWKDELWSLLNFAGHNSDEESDNVEDIDDEKLSALYGEEWKGKSIEKLLDIKFKEIPEFGQSGKKNLAFESAAELSAQLVKYTRNDKEKKGQAVRRQYWPLVKCVTIRVPNNDLLKHVTLVDLPGNGDCNKSRDEMWKTVIHLFFYFILFYFVIWKLYCHHALQRHTEKTNL